MLVYFFRKITKKLRLTEPLEENLKKKLAIFSNKISISTAMAPNVDC